MTEETDGFASLNLTPPTRPFPRLFPVAISPFSYPRSVPERHPTMRVFHKLMDYHLNEAEEGRAKESLMVLRDMVGEKVRSKPRYRCQKCGFTAYTLYWHCPSCRAWSTIKPIRGLDGL